MANPEIKVNERRRQAFRVATSATTKAKTARNSTESPLFRLPPEIRNRIWRELLGDKVLHIKRIHKILKKTSKNDKLEWEWDTGYRACFPTLKNEEPIGWEAHYFDAGSGPGRRASQALRKTLVLVNPREVDVAMVIRDLKHPVTVVKFDTPQLQILRSCRQAYLELNPILWGTNVFAFRDLDSFSDFSRVRNTVQMKLMRNLRLGIQPKRWEYIVFHRVLTAATIKRMRGLRSLEISIDPHLATTPSEYHRPKSSIRIFRGLAKFRVLELESVRVQLMAGCGSQSQEVKQAALNWAAALEKELICEKAPANSANPGSHAK